MRRFLIIGLVVLAALATGSWALAGRGYTVSVVLASATNVVEGGQVLVNGFEAGKVERISVQDGQALLELSLDGDYAPLHDGATVTIAWKALLGERLVDIKDGPGTAATIPDGGLIHGEQAKPMELDELLAALDPNTRAHLSSLVNQLQTTLHGNEKDLNATLHTAGPALQALGQVLQGLGSDGPAIKDLVARLNGMVGTLAAHDKDIRTIVEELSRTASATARQRTQLADSLRELPSTLDTAGRTLDSVPGVAGKATPLLQDLRPATQQLRSVADNLTPVLKDLRPLVGELGPTLSAAATLLDNTPALLDTAHGTIPGINAAVSYLQPALNFLRPFTPEVMGWTSAWASMSGNYDANGHYGRFLVNAGPTSVVDNPGITPPGTAYDPYPAPGANVGQPWTDAFGSGVR